MLLRAQSVSKSSTPCGGKGGVYRLRDPVEVDVMRSAAERRAVGQAVGAMQMQVEIDIAAGAHRAAADRAGANIGCAEGLFGTIDGLTIRIGAAVGTAPPAELRHAEVRVGPEILKKVRRLDLAPGLPQLMIVHFKLNASRGCGAIEHGHGKSLGRIGEVGSSRRSGARVVQR